MTAANRATASATDTASWQSVDAFSAAQGGQGQVATPRWPGAISNTEHEYPGEIGSYTGTPASVGENHYVSGLPWLDHNEPGIPVPVQAQGDGLPGRKSPSGVPVHDGHGGNAQVMANQGEDGSAAYYGRTALGDASLAPMHNLETRRMPTDWRKEYDAQGQLVSYTFDRPSLQVQQMYEKDTVPHYVEYEASPIYSRLAQIARQQDHVHGIWAPDGQTPDLTPYQDNTGNPVYQAPPDPRTTSAYPAQDSGYGLSDLYV